MTCNVSLLGDKAEVFRFGFGRNVTVFDPKVTALPEGEELLHPCRR